MRLRFDFEATRVPPGWEPLYNVQPRLEDAQVVLVRGYREQDADGARQVHLGRQNDFAGGTLLSVALPPNIARRHLVRAPKAPPHTYTVPAEVVNAHARIGFVRTGPDLIDATQEDAPLITVLQSMLSDHEARLWDARYEHLRQRLASRSSVGGPAPMKCQILFWAIRTAMADARDALPRLEVYERFVAQQEQETEFSGDDDDDDYRAQPKQPDPKAYEARDRLEFALQRFDDVTNPAFLGVIARILDSHKDSRDVWSRLRYFLAHFSVASSGTYGASQPTPVV